MGDAILDMPWWKAGPIYQIYPRSFLDTNGDGIGDLEGVRRKLDYLTSLGVRGIWLSPIYPSPMFDFGYDISNYHDIDPVFGTLHDFDNLVREADRRGIAIIMDMVLNHTSHLHPWFVESRSSRNNPKKDWYIWQDGRRGIFDRGGLFSRRYPNNWMAAFGGHAWTWEPLRKQYYLHLFTEQQPDLNWRNPEVQNAMLEEMRFWLDRGVKGFRLDVINYLVKDAHLRNNPYRFRFTYPRRHDLQHHQYDRNQQETLDIVSRIRDLMDAYSGPGGDTMLVGEVYPDEGVHAPDLAATYVGDGTELLHLAFDFSTIYMPFTADAVQSVLQTWYSVLSPHAWPCHVLSNHDQSRSGSRLCSGLDREAQKRLLAMLLLTQRGTPFLYYGEEIGMEDGHIRRADLQDPLGKKYYPLHPGRDRSRTPMQWDTSPYAGFIDYADSHIITNSSKTPRKPLPWLPVNSDYRERNVALQDNDHNSLLNWYRALITLRQNEPALLAGDIHFNEKGVQEPSPVLAYTRSFHGSEILVLLNISSTTQMSPVSQSGTILISTHRTRNTTLTAQIKLAPWEGTIIKL
ncbi:MAG: alpha-amylase family glycosyl hydrolase [Termitinemataceae bacterium]